MSAAERGWIGSFVDRYMGWKYSLPGESGSYTTQRFRIPINGIEIEADLYQPKGTETVGTIFVRTPYGIDPMAAIGTARVFAARGYQVLLSSNRGSGRSSGDMDPAANEVADGVALLEWMRSQAWYTGSFATLGGSYLGYNQYALLQDPPPDMKAAIISTGVLGMHNFIWGAGGLRGDIVAWADLTRRMRRGDGLISLMRYMSSQAATLKPVFDSLPLMDGVDEYFGGEAPAWLREGLAKPDHADEFWRPREQDGALRKAKIPILLATGWDDIQLQSVVHQYETLGQSGCEVALTVGPWTHTGSTGANFMLETFSWLETHLIQQKNADTVRTTPVREAPVRVFVTGAQEWRNLQQWGLTNTQTRELFLGAGKTLSSEAPSAKAGQSAFTFDPATPTPSIGGPMLFDNGSLRNADDTLLAVRSDVAVFETEILTQDVEVLGRPVITLQHSTSHPHADLLVVISDVQASGKSRSISEVYTRLDPTRSEQGEVTLTLADCAHRFLNGHKIRLLIAGGSHPRYIRNLGTGEDSASGSALQAVEHTVQHHSNAISKLVLPTVAII